LAVALNGTLVVFEHYVMAETLFLMLLTSAILTLVLAAREPTAARLLLAGLLLGLASATRQSAQALLTLAPVALLLAGLHWRRVVRGSLLVLAGFLVVLLPWLAFDYARHGTLSSGTLGETLVWRLTRGEDAGYFRFRPAPVDDPRLQEARRFALGQAADRVLPSDTKVALQQRFDLDEGAADSVLRGLALEAIGRQPDAYVLSSLGLLGEHLVGERQFLGGQGKSGGVTRYSDAQDKYSGFWSERTRPLVQNATPAQEQEFRRAQALTSLQPYRFAWLLLPLLGLGTVAALLRPDLRLGLVPALAALILLLLAAFLAGDLPRYRYPADPFLAVLEAGAVGWVVGLLAHLARATRRPRQLSPATARP
jgi:hypothetical protein